ncbi:MAG: sulfatase [bacterium]
MKRREFLKLRLRALFPIVLAAVLLAALGIYGCLKGRSAGRYNLILISIDTLRADRLGAYGYARDTSPNLNAFAEKGVLFRHVVAECSWTLPSHVTMLTGLFPSTHGATHPALKPGPDTEFLAEILRAEGYRTIGHTEGGYVGAEYGFGRGFEFFDDTRRGLPAILEEAAAQIREFSPDDRYFCFLHTYDVHCPYTPSEPYAEMFQTEDAQFIDTRWRCGNPHYNRMVLSEGQVRFLSNAYDASIREADEHLGRFIQFLETSGVLDNTVVVVTSDHGEEFREHGQIGHERTLYREVLMVPLIILAPGLTPMRVDTPVGLVDLTPTILDLLGLPVPSTMEGESLLPLATREPGTDPNSGTRISELQWQLFLRSVMTPKWHLILNLRTDEEKLFAVVNDPLEGQDLSAVNEKEVSQLLAVLERHRDGRQQRTPEPLDRVTPKQRELLRSLGYIN